MSCSVSAPPSASPLHASSESAKTVNAVSVDAADLYTIAEAQRDDEETASFRERLKSYPLSDGVTPSLSLAWSRVVPRARPAGAGRPVAPPAPPVEGT